MNAENVTIRPATAADIDGLPAIQVAAGALFRDIGMHRVADGPAPSTAGFQRACESGDLLVAADDQAVVGFVRTEVIDGSLHVEQVSVAPARQGRGIGRALMLAAEESARSRGFTRMTLTTFRDVPFNGPFYKSLGWTELAPESLGPGLVAARRGEERAGLDRWPRTVMTKALDRAATEQTVAGPDIG